MDTLTLPAELIDNLQDWSFYAEAHPDHPHTAAWALELCHKIAQAGLGEPSFPAPDPDDRQVWLDTTRGFDGWRYRCPGFGDPTVRFVSHEGTALDHWHYASLTAADIAALEAAS